MGAHDLDFLAGLPEVLLETMQAAWQRGEQLPSDWARFLPATSWVRKPTAIWRAVAAIRLWHSSIPACSH